MKSNNLLLLDTQHRICQLDGTVQTQDPAQGIINYRIHEASKSTTYYISVKLSTNLKGQSSSCNHSIPIAGACMS